MASICAASAAQVVLFDPQNPSPSSHHYIDQAGVRSIAFNHTGRVVALGNSSGVVSLFDTEATTPLGEIGGAQGPPLMPSISSISFSKGSKLLAIGGSSPDVKIFDLRSQTVSKTLSGHTHALASVLVSSQDKYVASSSVNGDVRVHFLNSGAEACQLNPVDSTAKSHLTFLQESAQMLAAGGDRGGLYVWDVFSSTVAASYPHAHVGRVTGLLPLNDSTGGSAIFSTGMDRSLLLTDLRMKTNASKAETPFAATCLAARDGSSQFAIGTSPGVVLLYDFRDWSKPLASKSLFASPVVDLQFRKEPLAPTPSKAQTMPAPSSARPAAASEHPSSTVPPPTSAAPPAPATLSQPLPAVLQRASQAQAQPQPQARPSGLASTMPVFPSSSSGRNRGEGSLQEASSDPLMHSFRGINELLALGRSMNQGQGNPSGPGLDESDQDGMAEDAAPSNADLGDSGRGQLGERMPNLAEELRGSVRAMVEEELAMGGGAAGGQMLSTIPEGTENGSMATDSPHRSLHNSREMPRNSNSNAAADRRSSQLAAALPAISRTELTDLIRFEVRQAVTEAVAALRDDLRELHLDLMRGHVQLEEQLLGLQLSGQAQHGNGRHGRGSSSRGAGAAAQQGNSKAGLHGTH